MAHYNIGVTKDMFNNSFPLWKNAWFLHTGATYHMTFHKYFFEYLSDNVDGLVYFEKKLKLKPSKIGTIMLKLIELPDFPLHDIFYLP